MGMLKEFKEFAMKGSLVEIAVAFVMGGAFGKVITSFTEGMVAPLVGLLTGKSLNENMLVIKDGVAAVTDGAGKVITEEIPPVAIQWGAFLTSVIDFVIVAFVLFLIIKAINSLKKKEEAAAPAGPSSTDILLTEIRDALKK